MKLEIILRILFELMSKKCVNATYLSQKYQVSKRSIYRYIACLEDAGVPLYTIRGYNGGFAIVDTYRISSTFMTMEEFEQTINALSAIENSIPDKVLTSVINKLKCVKKHEYSGLSIKSGNLIIDTGNWGDTVGYKSKLAVVKRSLDECRKLKIIYHDRNGEVSSRVIEPHIIVFKQGLWYVYAYCYLRNDFRFFKIGRIEEANVLSEIFTRKQISENDLPLDFWNNSVKTEYVEMEVSKNVLSDVEEWLGIENVEKVNEKFIAKANLPYDNGLITKIMSYGKGIKVLFPESLKNDIRENALEIIKHYKK